MESTASSMLTRHLEGGGGGGGRRMAASPTRRPSHPPPLLRLLGLLSCASTWCTTTTAPQGCPSRCVCQSLFPSLGTLCTRRGLLFVPPDVDRRTVELHLADNFVSEVGTQDFSNMTDLVDLTLSRNQISAVAPYSFGDLAQLSSLHLDGNRLTALLADHLRGLFSLRRLRVNNNQLATVADAAFQDFVETLEDLDLSYNNLEGVPWAALQSMVNLHTLSLEHNLISSVSAGAFDRTPKLSRLDLTSNKLRGVPPDPAFTHPDAALVLALGGNPLHCNCELLWLRRRLLDGDLETCASPRRLLGRYVLSVPEGDFACSPPVITRHTLKQSVLEGEATSLRCDASGDPRPAVEWVSPSGRRVARGPHASVSPVDGALRIAVTAAGDDGTFTCVATNAAGHATAYVDLKVINLPHPGEGKGRASGAGKPAGSSDIAAPPGGDAAQAVAVSDVMPASVLVTWTHGDELRGLKMFQIQYNCSTDDSLVYRMIPATSKRFRVSQLVGGSDYDLCVLALCARAGAPSASTRALGCVRFSTPAPVRSGADDADCSGALTGAHAGGTVVLVIAALIVASLLAFIGVYVARNRGALGRAARADGCGRWCPAALEAADSCRCRCCGSGSGRSRDVAKSNGGMAQFPDGGGGGGAAPASPTASYDRRPLRHDRRRADEAPAYESADFFGGTHACYASSVSSRGSLGSSDGRSSVTPDSVSLSSAGQAGNKTAAATAASRSGSIATAGATCDCGVRSEIDRLLANAFFSPASPASPAPLGGARLVSASDDGDCSTADSRQSSLVPGSERAPLLGAASYSAGAAASSTLSASSHAGQRLARLLGLQSAAAAAPPAGAVAALPAAGEFPRGRAKRSQSFEARSRKRKSDPGDLTGGGTLPRNADGAKMAARRSLCLSSEWVMESTV
ncbi:leucine-rich repeat and fibronectin type-III domain-containing protein 4-like [Petromyzon marinus]|uniref:leucine-rich repeat and fibronectin type-III domain-containing protein 4-like n=1 Tax=Petromyzon marinus TaxID=7757 RepID=UPI003F6F09F9